MGVEDGNFALWVYPCYDLLIITFYCIHLKVGTLVSITTKMLLVANPDKVGETLQRLARIGYTNV